MEAESESAAITNCLLQYVQNVRNSDGCGPHLNLHLTPKLKTREREERDGPRSSLSERLWRWSEVRRCATATNAKSANNETEFDGEVPLCSRVSTLVSSCLLSPRLVCFAMRWGFYRKTPFHIAAIRQTKRREPLDFAKCSQRTSFMSAALMRLRVPPDGTPIFYIPLIRCSFSIWRVHNLGLQRKQRKYTYGVLVLHTSGIFIRVLVLHMSHNG